MTVHHQVQLEPTIHERHDIFQAELLILSPRSSDMNIAMKRTSIELNGLPSYASTKSAASAGLANLTNAMDRFGAKSLHARIICHEFAEE